MLYRKFRRTVKNCKFHSERIITLLIFLKQLLDDLSGDLENVKNYNDIILMEDFNE